MRKAKFKTLLEAFIAYMDTIVRISPRTVSKNGVKYKIEHAVRKHIKISEIVRGFFQKEMEEEISTLERHLKNQPNKIADFAKALYGRRLMDAARLCRLYKKHLRKLYEPQGIVPVSFPFQSGFCIECFVCLSDMKAVA